jgi:hypothetical protein
MDGHAHRGERARRYHSLPKMPGRPKGSIDSRPRRRPDGTPPGDDPTEAEIRELCAAIREARGDSAPRGHRPAINPPAVIPGAIHAGERHDHDEARAARTGLDVGP